jgi:hypothetical protein
MFYFKPDAGTHDPTNHPFEIEFIGNGVIKENPSDYFNVL